MDAIREELTERTKSIVAYLRLLKTAEMEGPSLVKTSGARIFSHSTLHVLKAGVFLHLYNLVESTVSQGLTYIAETIESSNLRFERLKPAWRRCWGLHMGVGRSNPELRLDATLRFCLEVAQGTPAKFDVSIPVGNLDDRKIEELFRKYEIRLSLRPTVLSRVKYQVLNDLGFLGLIRRRRNDLAHGASSFFDVGSSYSVQDLSAWTWSTNQYLRDVLASIQTFVLARGYETTVPAAPTSSTGPSPAPADGS